MENYALCTEYTDKRQLYLSQRTDVHHTAVDFEKRIGDIP
jgi:hypothetical protein